MDKSSNIFGNVMNSKTVRKAEKSKAKYQKKFGDDSQTDYPLTLEENAYIGESLGVQNIVISEKEGIPFDEEKGIIVGNIRMGFGHYRISMAIASAANSMGYKPYWMDLASYSQTTGAKVINAQNKLYSLGSRISGKSKLFNHFVWEPMNYEGFRKLSYNACDQKNAELMTPIFKHVPKEIPVVATHVWPSQAAVHAGMKYVVNAIPDNWPMGLHLSEGSIHTVQTHSSKLGYQILNGMDGKKTLMTMPEEDIVYTGHYIDHELVANIENDCNARIARMEKGEPMRFLLTIGGAGAQKEIFVAIIRHLLPAIRTKRAALFINVGDYKNVWEQILRKVPEMKGLAVEHFDNWKETESFANDALAKEVTGIHGFWHRNIFEAVYATNLQRCNWVSVNWICHSVLARNFWSKEHLCPLWRSSHRFCRIWASDSTYYHFPCRHSRLW